MGNCPDRVMFEADYAVDPNQELTPVAFDFIYVDIYRLGLNISNTRFTSQPAGTTVLVWQNTTSFNGIWRNDGQQRDDEGNRVLTPTTPGLPNITPDIIAACGCNQTKVYVKVRNPTQPTLEWFLCRIDRDSQWIDWGLRITPLPGPPPDAATLTAVSSFSSMVHTHQQRREQQQQQQQQLTQRGTQVGKTPSVVPPCRPCSFRTPALVNDNVSTAHFVVDNIATVLDEVRREWNLTTAIDIALQKDPKMSLCKFVKKYKHNKFDCTQHERRKCRPVCEEHEEGTQHDRRRCRPVRDEHACPCACKKH